MAQPASGKPSLIDTMPSSRGTTHGDDASIRMLDALESGTRPTTGVAKRRGIGWLVAALLLLVVCGASWSWWSQRSRADDSTDRITRISAPSRAVAASAVIDPPSAATIVATAEPAAPAVTAASNAAAAASTPSMAASPTAPAVAHQAAAKPAKTKTQASTSARETHVATASKTEQKKSARATATTSRSTAAASSNDPDVALLSAMLATMSRDARAGSDSAPSPQAQLTIAQLVQRCDTRGVKDAIETFECKRRICDGYWGKADACPMSLSPKKN